MYGFIKKLVMMTLLCVSVSVFAETAWVITPQISFQRMMLMQYCFDNGSAGNLEFCEDGEINYFRIGKNAVFNTRGVAVFVLPVEKFFDTPAEGAFKNSETLLLEAAKNAKKASDAVEIIKKAVDNSEFSEGAVFMIADARCAFIAEATPNYFGSKDVVPGGLCTYVNMFRLPQLDVATDTDRVQLWAMRTRETIAARKLYDRCGDDGIKVVDSTSVSRTPEIFGQKQELLGPFFPGVSAGGVVIDIDPEFPADLSGFYIAVGSPGHSVYVPMPAPAAAKGLLKYDELSAKVDQLYQVAGEFNKDLRVAINSYESGMFASFYRNRLEAGHMVRRLRYKDGRERMIKHFEQQQKEIISWLDKKINEYEQKGK
jgi:hypothetical protein